MDLSGVIRILLAPLFMAWVASVYHRCDDNRVRNCVMAVGVLAAAWQIVTSFKYSFVSSGQLTSYLWYFFYVPMIGGPTLCLFAAGRSAGIDSKAWGKMAHCFVAVVSIVLLCLIFTNNFHHLVFQFSFDDPNWCDDYTYRIGYWMTLVWIIALLVAFFAVLAIAGRKNKRKGLAPMAILFVVGLLFGISYITRVEIAAFTSMSFLYSLVCVGALEIALRMGILPTCTWQHSAFEGLPSSVVILDKRGEVFAKTRATASDALKAIEESSVKSLMEGEWPNPDQRAHGYPIPGGSVLVIDDMSRINRQRELLDAKNEKLSRQNEALSRALHAGEVTRRVSEERHILRAVEDNLAIQFARMEALSLQLAEETDTMAARRMLAELRLTAAYCKRQGALVLMAVDGQRTDIELEHIVAQELSSDLSCAGVSCAVRVLDGPEISAFDLVRLYHAMFQVSLSSLNHPGTGMVAAVIHDDPPIVRVLWELGSTEEAQQAAADLEGIGGISVGQEDEQLTVILSCAAEGGGSDGA